MTSELAGELLVYNYDDQRAHCVSALAHQVLLRCDGDTPAARIAASLRQAGRSAHDAEVNEALSQLARAGLVELDASRLTSSGRRNALKRMGLTAGLAVAAPMVWSIVAPSVAEAASIACMTGACQLGQGGQCCDSGGGMAGTCAFSVCFPVGCMGADTCR